MGFCDLAPGLVRTRYPDDGSPFDAMPGSVVDVSLDLRIAIIGSWSLYFTNRCDFRAKVRPRRPRNPQRRGLDCEPHLIDVRLRLLRQDVEHDFLEVGCV